MSEVDESLDVYPGIPKLFHGGDIVAEPRAAERSQADTAFDIPGRESMSNSLIGTQLVGLCQGLLFPAGYEEVEVFPALEQLIDQNGFDKLSACFDNGQHAAPPRLHRCAPETLPGKEVLGSMAAPLDRILATMYAA